MSGPSDMVAARVFYALKFSFDRILSGMVLAVMALAMPGGVTQANAQTVPPQTEPEITYGNGDFIRSDDQPQRRGPDRLADHVSATYRNAEIEAVVNQIIGEALGLDFTVANDVRGQITLRMNNIETRSGVIRQLRDALAAVGVTLIDRGDFIAVVRGGGAGQNGAVALLRPGEPAPPGSGVAVFSLDHASASEIGNMVVALAPGARLALADDRRRVLIYSGEAAVLSAVSEAVAMVDVDWFAQVSTGLFTLQHVSPSELIGEMRPLLGVAAGGVEFVAIDRLNILVVMATSPGLLRRLETWIGRLDEPRTMATSSGQLVYTVQHADPEDLLSSLYQLLGVQQYGAGAGGFGQAGSFAPDQTYRDPSRRTPAGGGMTSAALDDVQIGAAPNQNIILVRGEPERVAEISELLELLDRPRPQVLIEAAIVEATLTDSMSFGVNWAGILNEHVAIAWSDNATAAPEARFPGVSATYLNTDLEAAITALSSETELEVISRPSVLALHNEQAELQVGDQVPVVLQSAVSIDNPDAPLVNQTAYRNTGVILTVRPQIRAGGMVEIEISQEVSGVAQTTSSGIDSPTITQRRISSTLLIPSGEAVALGGLISTRRTSGASGVPILRDVPVLGRAFRSDSQSEDRTELLVLLTPRIIADPNELSDVMTTLPGALARLEARLQAQ
ncbi:secretin N-terminal domain-containing protein [Maricaulis sp.]|uniref:secretin N-terminal domain-containing protein n=1 Tax=Maricaulis sp. TaxID=1486257 RepID=UPI00261E2861|nr:secretin N-terminal domain-containing protein [Maricaulis sp.]